MEKTTVPISMRVDPDLKAALKRAAAKENRSLANLIETVLRRYAAGACSKQAEQR